MRCVAWIHASADPWRSGALRRLGVPALLCEADGWESQFVCAADVGRIKAAQIAIVPLQALGALSEIAQLKPTPTVIVEADVLWADKPSQAFAALKAVENRIAGVVARGPRVAAKIRRVCPSLPVWIIPDIAARAVELAAAMMRFDLEAPPAPGASIASGYDLWFCEPGDLIGPDEVGAAVANWATGSRRRVVVAPEDIRSWLSQAGLAFEGHDWSPVGLQDAIAGAKRCVFFGSEGYSQSRRRTLALRAGGAAVRPRTVALQIHEPMDVGAAWRRLLAQVAAPRPELQQTGPVMVFLDLVQDLDLLSPLIDALKAMDVPMRIVVSSWLQKRSPRVSEDLQARGLPFLIYDRAEIVDGVEPPVADLGAVVTAAESSLAAHDRAHALFRRARSHRVPTFSCQHGVENVGLVHLEHEKGEPPQVLSDHFLSWADPNALPSTATATLRPRLVHTGRLCAKPRATGEIGAALLGFKSIAAVFENLHWDRYDADWRSRFLADCVEFAQADETRAVILKPHHGGLWAVRNAHLAPSWPTNLVLADPTDSFWEPFTAPSVLRVADVVITTPSTVALDAVQAGKPVAVAAYGLNLPAYAPLPMLNGLEDWLAFAAAGGSVVDARRRAEFLARTATGETPADTAASYIVEVMRERAAARQQAVLEPGE